ncbi:TetR-like C-terminal domain-containing protein [Actinomadura opuntiae]|uniref:TetR-like C-terminal domain-containing protein n=1 Tax=Actinomadura sp. OS1-43 TaxID=604315 RepID=UPI00255AEA9B|nr:TetR-like C-terminal domain-containing protein [Actinomadura sp. OS1-43]MDL4822066.1 TetR-like C-terminal domain-containing protein [Actinomadura sp. OS1-43]
MGRRKTRTDALRGELLAVAARLLAAGGTGAVTTRAVASGADASLAAVNELFGGKAGLVRALFTDGFARLAADLRALAPAGDPETGVLELALAVRSFARREPHLHEVMFSRPFAEFRPEPADARAAEEVYAIVVGRVAAVLGPDRAQGTAKDSAIGLFATVQGLLSLETSGLLGSTPEAAERRFRLTVTAALRGLADAAARSPQEAR